jgi:hypothetical protein
MTANNGAASAANGDARPIFISDALSDIPAIRQMAERGARFVIWRLEDDGRKLPLQRTGRVADTTRAETWAELGECLDAVDQLNASGIGLVLASHLDEAGGHAIVVGIDLDNAIDPATGAIRPWALEVVRDCNTYTETSPSGTGLKLYGTLDRPIELAAHKLVIQPENGAKPQQLEAYTTARFFALTGAHLDGTPDELGDVTEAFERLAYRLNAHACERVKDLPKIKLSGAVELTERVEALIRKDPAVAQLWAGVKTTGDTSASGLDASLALLLHRGGCSQDEIEAALRAYPHGQIGAGTLTGRLADRRLRRLIGFAKSAKEGKQKDSNPDQTSDSRVAIRLAEERINAIARQCARLLDDEVFLRGPMPTVLVQVEEIGGQEADDAEAEPGVIINGVRHARGALILAEPTPGRIQFRLDEPALFQRYDRRSDGWLPRSCPSTIARRIIDAAPELRFRPCAGIVAVPLFVRGEVVATPGYHRPTGSILELPSNLPTLPDCTGRAEAKQALETLLGPFTGYIDGKSEGDRKRLRCAFAAAALTAVLRPSLQTALTILLDANVPGAGKGKAARALAVIATGRYPAVITEGPSDEETEKRLASAILSGAPAILLDNLQRAFASSTLESGLTEGVATIRLFGKLVDVTVPCSALVLVLVTANNASLRPDMLRRTLPVRIVADTEQPELRRFAFDPYQEAKRNRLSIVAAGLTIAKAWWAVRETEDGRRIRQKTLGSFEQWSEVVAGAVEWLTGMNPVDLIEERKTEDPRRGDERAVIAALAIWQGRRLAGQWWPAKEAVGGIVADLWANVIQVKDDRPDSRQVGNWLRARKDRVFGDLQLTGRVDRNGVMQWTVRGLKALAGSVQYAVREMAGNTPAACGCQNESTKENRPPKTPQTPHPGGSSEPDADEEFEP